MHPQTLPAVREPTQRAMLLEKAAIVEPAPDDLAAGVEGVGWL
jgi:hypothetical protein